MANGLIDINTYAHAFGQQNNMLKNNKHMFSQIDTAELPNIIIQMYF